MTNRSFIEAVRQYRDHARRRNRSYAVQVELLLLLRLKAIEESADSETEKARNRQTALHIVMAEYAAVDKSFVPPTVG
jgi:hypothetical protein